MIYPQRGYETTRNLPYNDGFIRSRSRAFFASPVINIEVIMDRRVEVFINLMKEDLSRELLIDDVAKWLNISPSRLRYLFKVETGQPPSQYLKYLRMQRAKQLVESTFLNVKQIMYELGINDESHFVRDFKRTYGITITQYRHACSGHSGGANEARPSS